LGLLFVIFAKQKCLADCPALAQYKKPKPHTHRYHIQIDETMCDHDWYLSQASRGPAAFLYNGILTHQIQPPSHLARSQPCQAREAPVLQILPGRLRARGLGSRIRSEEVYIYICIYIHIYISKIIQRERTMNNGLKVYFRLYSQSQSHDHDSGGGGPAEL
jgi:hypothetical protein